MKNCRIVKRTFPGELDKFVIQQKHWIFFWKWVDAWQNSLFGASCKDTFSTLEDAKHNVRFFDGTKVKDTVIKTL